MLGEKKPIREKGMKDEEGDTGASKATAGDGRGALQVGEEEKLPDDGRLSFVELGVQSDRKSEVSVVHDLVVGEGCDQVYTSQR
jgi:hypothetical protein